MGLPDETLELLLRFEALPPGESPPAALYRNARRLVRDLGDRDFYYAA